MSPPEKIYLLIIDGFGEGKIYPGNAIHQAKMPHFRHIRQTYPHTLLKSSGEAVGLPQGTQGGSEVGHFTMGMGRVIFQSLEEINQSIHNKSFFKKEPFLTAIKKIKTNPKANLHLLGMISDQGVHSHLDHLFALLELAKTYNIPQTYIHAITDGRDVPEKTAKIFLEKIEKKINVLGFNKKNSKADIASIIGRYYAMDRDNNWDRTEKAYNLYALGQGIQEKNTLTAIENAYKRGIASDYYIEPIIINPHGLINDNDAVIFWNFRTDRTKQITYCFTHEAVIGFKPQKEIKPYFVCMGDYSKKAPIVFPTQKVVNNLGSVLDGLELNQLRIAETEKYAHVTYFFNSQIEKPFIHEKRLLIDSPKVPSYAEKPEMSAREITHSAIQEIAKNKYHLIVQNFANPDLVGHSGNLKATMKACEIIDECIGKIHTAAKKYGYNLLITADHGNAEYMIYEENGEPCPSHTKNPVPFCFVSEKHKNISLEKNRGLQDIAPTILDLMNIPKPKEMTGNTLIKKL